MGELAWQVGGSHPAGQLAVIGPRVGGLCPRCHLGGGRGWAPHCPSPSTRPSGSRCPSLSSSVALGCSPHSSGALHMRPQALSVSLTHPGRGQMTQTDQKACGGLPGGSAILALAHQALPLEGPTTPGPSRAMSCLKRQPYTGYAHFSKNTCKEACLPLLLSNLILCSCWPFPLLSLQVKRRQHPVLRSEQRTTLGPAVPSHPRTYLC